MSYQATQYHSCPHQPCPAAYASWEDLHLHIETGHGNSSHYPEPDSQGVESQFMREEDRLRLIDCNAGLQQVTTSQNQDSASSQCPGPEYQNEESQFMREEDRFRLIEFNTGVQEVVTSQAQDSASSQCPEPDYQNEESYFMHEEDRLRLIEFNTGVQQVVTSQAQNSGTQLTSFSQTHTNLEPYEPYHVFGRNESASEASVNRYRCVMRDCDVTFPTLKDVVDHIDLAHGLGDNVVGTIPRHQRRVPQICPTCKKVISNLSAHIRRVHKHEKNFACHHCNSTFYAAQELRKHLQLRHDLSFGPRTYNLLNGQWSFAESSHNGLQENNTQQPPRESEEEARRNAQQQKQQEETDEMVVDEEVQNEYLQEQMFAVEEDEEDLYDA